MTRLKDEFPNLRSVKVTVEERRIGWEGEPGSWRTHRYDDFEKMPLEVLPAFASLEKDALLDLRKLIRAAWEKGAVEQRFESPYHERTGREKTTILRSVIVQLGFAE